MGPLTFADLRRVNVERCASGVFGHNLLDWNATDWGCALAGETGELCNLLKKRRLGRRVDHARIRQELADVQIYLDLTAFVCDVDLADATIFTFNAKSEEVGSPSRLAPGSLLDGIAPWCLECQAATNVDEDGCCIMCGQDAFHDEDGEVRPVNALYFRMLGASS